MRFDTSDVQKLIDVHLEGLSLGDIETLLLVTNRGSEALRDQAIGKPPAFFSDVTISVFQDALRSAKQVLSRGESVAISPRPTINPAHTPTPR